MASKGQVTIFILLGIVILITFSLAIYLETKTKQFENPPPVLTIDTLASSFKSNMEACFRPKVIKAISQLGVQDKLGLNQYLKLSLKECFDAVSYYGAQVQIRLPMKVEIKKLADSYLIDIKINTKLTLQNQIKEIAHYQVRLKVKETPIGSEDPKITVGGREFSLNRLNKIQNESVVKGELIVSYQKYPANDTQYNLTLSQLGIYKRKPVFDPILTKPFNPAMDKLIREMGKDERLFFKSADYRTIRKKLLEYSFVESVSLNNLQYPHKSYVLLHKLVRKSDPFVNDEFYKYQWYLKNNGRFFGTIGSDINIEKAWEISAGDENTLITIIDQGIFNNVDLQPSILFNHSYDLVDWDNNIFPTSSREIHGSHVAGVIGSQTNNWIGMAGICPKCKIINVRTMDQRGEMDTPTLLNAVLYGVSKGSRIISMSLGKTKYSEYEDKFFQKLANQGVVFIAAAGNDGLSQKNYPAAYSSVISVGATDNNDDLSQFSNHGSWVDLTAPGEMILSVCGERVYCFSSGTSMAVPMVSAVVGLMLSVDSSLTSAEVKKYLLAGADEIDYTTQRLNAGGTLGVLR